MYRTSKLAAFNCSYSGFTGTFGCGFQTKFACESTVAKPMLRMLAVSLARVARILARFAATRFTRPILAIVRAAKEIGEGNLNVRIELKRSDELGLLAESIHGMAQRLNETMVSKSYFNHGAIFSFSDPSKCLWCRSMDRHFGR